MLRDITIGQHFPGNSILHTMDPRVKLLLTIAYIVMLFVGSNPAGLVISIVFLTVLYLVAKIPLKIVGKSIKPILPIILFTAVLNLFFMGIIVEKGMQLFDKYLPERTFGVRVLLMCIAVVMMCFASALYFTADMGVSAYDAYALILDKRTRIPFRMCRIGTDVLTTAAGFFMGAVVGVGTLVTAFFMGPLIEFFNRTVARPFLYGKENKQMQKQ